MCSRGKRGLFAEPPFYYQINAPGNLKIIFTKLPILL